LRWSTAERPAQSRIAAAVAAAAAVVVMVEAV
jgi:hypothetical protein